MFAGDEARGRDQHLLRRSGRASATTPSISSTRLLATRAPSDDVVLISNGKPAAELFDRWRTGCASAAFPCDRSGCSGTPPPARRGGRGLRGVPQLPGAAQRRLPVRQRRPRPGDHPHAARSSTSASWRCSGPLLPLVVRAGGGRRDGVARPRGGTWCRCSAFPSTVSSCCRARRTRPAALPPTRRSCACGGASASSARICCRSARSSRARTCRPCCGPSIGCSRAPAPRRPTIDLVVVGGRGWRDRELRAEIAKRLSTGRLHTLGYVPERDLVALYGGAEVLAYPSHFEGFGLPVIEAMACGTPVVATDVEALREVSGGAAVLVPLGDEAALADAVATIDRGSGRARRDARARGSRAGRHASAGRRPRSGSGTSPVLTHANRRRARTAAPVRRGAAAKANRHSRGRARHRGNGPDSTPRAPPAATGTRRPPGPRSGSTIRAGRSSRPWCTPTCSTPRSASRRRRGPASARGSRPRMCATASDARRSRGCSRCDPSGTLTLRGREALVARQADGVRRTAELLDAPPPGHRRARQPAVRAHAGALGRDGPPQRARRRRHRSVRRRHRGARVHRLHDAVPREHAHAPARHPLPQLPGRRGPPADRVPPRPVHRASGDLAGADRGGRNLRRASWRANEAWVRAFYPSYVPRPPEDSLGVIARSSASPSARLPGRSGTRSNGCCRSPGGFTSGAGRRARRSPTSCSTRGSSSCTCPTTGGSVLARFEDRLAGFRPLWPERPSAVPASGAALG